LLDAALLLADIVRLDVQVVVMDQQEFDSKFWWILL